ncbi:putative F-actin-capping protein subunit beta [Blattamonas nauphoetae]|uniref:F-actin-capping protein subunit beta n=1 Tax=Blattamonas nauphoetae TaxID=2049346 RepID=A0ABQ9Y2T0_9EUKA|nr:putative F-actin-capping protein subunit beta [Blattamonas nauphoetae]
MAENKRMAACLDITRRMNPAEVEQTQGDLIFLAEDLTGQILANVDLPLQLETDTSVGRSFIISDYNRDGDSYRSPHSNKYFPPYAEGALPSAELRQLETEANELMAKYVELYYEKGGESSAYFWDSSDGVAAAVLIKKEYNSKETGQQGTWNSIHIFKITPFGTGKFNFTLTTTVSLQLGIDILNLAGNLVRKAERKSVRIQSGSDKVRTMGQMIEESENKMRAHIETVYFGRLKGIVSDLRSVTELKNLPSNRMVIAPN